MPSCSTSKSKSNPLSHQLSTAYKSGDINESYMIPALNIVFIKDSNKWVWLDARGNTENINDYSFKYNYFFYIMQFSFLCMWRNIIYSLKTKLLL